MIPPRIAVVFGTALVLWAPPASAELRVRLDSGVVDRCPDPQTIDQRWQARSSSDALVELHVVPVGGRLLGVVRAAPRGSPPAARRLRAERDGCSALIDALLTSAALLTATIELPAPPEPPSAEPPPAEPPPAEPQPAAPPPPTIDDSPATTLNDGGGPWRWLAGARGDVGTAPSATIAGEFGLSHRWPLASVGGALHIGATPTADVGTGQVAVERYAVGLHGCWHPSVVALCGFGRAGAVALRPSALDGADVVEPMVDAGLRAIWRLPLDDAWALLVDAEISAPLRRLQLNVDGAPSWLAAPIAGGGGVALQWAP